MPTNGFQFKREADDLRIEVAAAKFDAANVREFRLELDHIWDRNLSSVTIDFSSVEFIDSSGIGALLSVQKRLKPEAEAVKILNARPNVLKVIELLRLHRVFNLQMEEKV